MKTLPTPEEIKGIENYLLWGYGKRCPDYDPGCPVCNAWEDFDYYLKVVKSKNADRKTKHNKSR